MIKEIGLTLKAIEFAIKYKPIRYATTFLAEKSRLKEVTFERIKIKKIPASEKNDNAYSASFLNQVIRSYAKMHRTTSKKTGNKSKIEKPLTLRERTLVKFHSDKEIKLDYLGSYYKRERGNILVQKTDTKIFDEIFGRISKPKIRKKNQIICLQGNIGCGKSTLLSTLVVKTVELNSIQERKQAKNFIPLDIAIISFEKIKIPKDIDSSEQLLDLFYRTIHHEICKQVKIEASNLEELLIDVSKTLRFTLILDGLDFLYVAHCKMCFELKSKLSLYYMAINNIVNDFTNGKFKDIGINVIVAFRNETLHIIKKASDEISGTVRLKIGKQDTYSLISIPKENLNLVFEKRCKYAFENDQENQITINNHYHFSEYHGIAVHGLRHIMDTWEKIFCYVPLKEVAKRVLEDKNMFKIFFLSSGVNHYSQVNHGLTNIYLVNPNYRANAEDISIDDAINMDRKTYWLKYFMMVYIIENNTDLPTVLNVFTTKANFPPSLVKIILMGFSEVEHGRILKPNVGGISGHSTSIVGLEATSRAKNCMQSGLFFSFEYLSCISEDTYFRVPSSILDSYSEPLSLKFLTHEKTSDYEEGRKAYIREKARSVFTTIVLLEEAYEIEKKRDPELFKVLGTERYQKYEPNFLKMRDDSIRGLQSLVEDYSKAEQREILGIAIESLKIRERATIRKSLQGILKD